MPEYPPLPRSVRFQVVQTVKVLLSEQAAPQTVESSIEGRTPGMEQSFKDSAEKALKNSQFSKSCGGKTITLVFHYEFREDDKKSPFAFGPPNQFWIRAGPSYVMPAGSHK
jgi:hypothetical protein